MDANTFNQLASPCDNIIFDYGGIFVDVVYQDAIDNLQSLAPQVDVSEIYNKRGQISLFDQFEMGRVSGEEFLLELKRLLKIENVETRAVERAWNSMLKDIHPLRALFLEKLKKTKRIFMLSNINEIHEKRLKKIISEKEELKGFYSHFENVHFSHRMGLRKPDREAFDRVLEENSLNPEKTFFMDDSPQHVEGAKRLGLKAILLDPPNSFIASFKS